MNDPTGLKAMFPTIAFAAAESDRLALKRTLMDGGRWNDKHAQLDEQQRLHNLKLLEAGSPTALSNLGEKT